MDYTTENMSPEVDRLRGRLLTLEQQLNECHRDRNTARQTSESLRPFLDGLREYAFITLNRDARILSWSRGAERLLGYTEAEVLGQPGSIIFTPEDCACGADAQELETARKHGTAEEERWHIRKDRTRFWGSGLLTAQCAGDDVCGYSKLLRDLTDRKLADDRLRASEDQLRLFTENVLDYALVPVDMCGMIAGWNTGAERTFGYSQREIIGQPAATFFTPEDVQKGESERDLSEALANGRSEDERWMVRKDGSRFWARWVTTAMHDDSNQLRGFAKVLRDETEKKNAEDRLKASLQEKEVLLREIHHRVKNNLLVITNLLSLHAAQMPDESVRRTFRDLQDRVRAIAALHETLYASPNLANILFGPYLDHLVHNIVGFHQIDSRQVTVQVESDDVALSVEQALPLGLIANELTSNALKYAVSKVPEGVIAVSLRYVPERTEDGQKLDPSSCELAVQDNGPGLANPEEFWNSSSMGLRIVRLLTDQLRGTLALQQEEGTRISVRFPLIAAESSSVAGAPLNLAGSQTGSGLLGNPPVQSFHSVWKEADAG
jgi:PAS domain S-box-containing protein